MCKSTGRRILKGMLLAVKWLWVALLTVTLAAGIIFGSIGKPTPW